ncbi:MAG: hypothetical protein ACK41D_09845 [Rubricoccaceae bacterium]
MNRNDAIAFAVSLGVHALLLLVFAGASAIASPPERPAPPELVELDFVPLPAAPQRVGEPQTAPAAAPAEARLQPEVERPAPPAPTPARVPERRPTPPRETPPIPRPTPDPQARPARPSPPSPATQPEPRPTPPRNPAPTQGSGSTQGTASTDGQAQGAGSGSGGAATVEVGFNFGNRSFDCPGARTTYEGAPTVVTYQLTFSPSGALVGSRAQTRGGGPAAEFVASRVLPSCRAQPLPAAADQRNQTTTATFRLGG